MYITIDIICTISHLLHHLFPSFIYCVCVLYKCIIFIIFVVIYTIVLTQCAVTKAVTIF